jgi:probable HAF family extracellular repeat protein
MVGLGFLPGGNYSDAWGISADGSVIVGDALNAANSSEAFRWTESDGLVGLGIPTGMIGSGAVAVSADGQVIVGSFTDGSEGGSEAFRWTQAGGMVGLGGAGSYAADVSGDGNIIVGAMNTGAFVWTEQRGLQSLQTIFTHEFSLGGQLAGWQLQTAEAMSEDGRVFGGEALDPSGREEAWIVDLGRPLSLTPVPEPSTYGLLAAALLVALALARRSGRKTRPIG